jgi:hypothetical protein
LGLALPGSMQRLRQDGVEDAFWCLIMPARRVKKFAFQAAADAILRISPQEIAIYAKPDSFRKIQGLRFRRSHGTGRKRLSRGWTVLESHGMKKLWVSCSAMERPPRLSHF